MMTHQGCLNADMADEALVDVFAPSDDISHIKSGSSRVLRDPTLSTPTSSMSTHSQQTVETHSASSANSTRKMSKAPARSNFTDQENAFTRKLYLKVFVGGCFSVILAIFAFFSIYWGALWKSPVRNLDGWVIDFDGALVGQNVVQALTSAQVSHQGKVTWSSVPASQFPNGLEDVAYQLREQKTWVAVAIHEGTTQRLQASYTSPNASYDPTSAITIYGVEARNENAFRSLIRPSAEAALQQISQKFATQAASQLLARNANVTAILATSPQTLLSPIFYTTNNLIPFDVPVATAITFVGLIYQLILSFFVVMIGAGARDASGINQKLNLKSLIIVRLISSFGAYFVLSLFYALLSLAFQVDFTRKFGHGGFVIFWMLNWAGMLSVGLALESLITLLTTRFMPFFMILWIISNVAVCVLPIEVLPVVFRYGYVAPFYNVSRAVRTIVFGTKNQVGDNFAVLIVWTIISCISLPIIQWFVRRSEDRQATVAGGPGDRSNGVPQTESEATRSAADDLEKDLADGR